MSVDTSVIGQRTGAWRVALDPSVLANFATAADSAHMTFVVTETQWTDARDGSPVVTERFNLIARFKR